MYFEDFRIGEEFETDPRTVTEGEVRGFARLTRDRNPIHLDETFARNTPFGRPIAHGMLTLSLALGLWAQKGLTRESLVALVSLEDVRFLRPVYPGDSIRLRSRIQGVREARSRPGAGLVTYEEKVLNNSQETVLEYRRTVLLKRRTPLAPRKG